MSVIYISEITSDRSVRRFFFITIIIFKLKFTIGRLLLKIKCVVFIVRLQIQLKALRYITVIGKNRLK